MNLNTTAVVLVIAALVATLVAYERWQWAECRKVGHEALYCVSELSK